MPTFLLLLILIGVGALTAGIIHALRLRRRGGVEIGSRPWLFVVCLVSAGCGLIASSLVSLFYP